MDRYSFGSLRLPAEVATGWKQRITIKITRSADRDGRINEVPAPRINALDHLVAVRAFYLDITQWATRGPVPVGPWVAPCPIRDTEPSLERKKRSHRKSRMDQRDPGTAADTARAHHHPQRLPHLRDRPTARRSSRRRRRHVHHRRADPAPVTHPPTPRSARPGPKTPAPARDAT